MVGLRSLAKFSNHYSTVCFAVRTNGVPPSSMGRLRTFHHRTLKLPSRTPITNRCSLMIIKTNVTKVDTTISTTHLNYEMTLVGSHPIMNNGGDSRVHIRLKNHVRRKACGRLNNLRGRFNPRGKKGTRPTRCCRSRGGVS